MTDSWDSNPGSPGVDSQDEDFLVDFLRTSSLLIFSVRPDGTLEHANPATLQALRYSVIDLEEGVQLRDLIPRHLHDDFDRFFNRALTGERVHGIRTCLMTRNGRTIHVEGEADGRLGPGGSVRVRTVFRDISEIVEGEVRRAELETRFQTVADSLLEGIAILDEEGRVEFLNPSAEQILGIARSDVIGLRILDFRWRTVSEDGSELPREEHPALVALRTGKAQPETTVGLESAAVDGTRWVSVSSLPLFGGEGVTGSVSSFRDVSERRKMGLAVLASRNRFRMLAQEVPVGIFETDAEGQCLFVNDRWSELAGLSLEDALGDGWVRAIYEGDRARVFVAWSDAADSGRAFQAEYRFGQEGEQRWVVGHATPIRDESGTVTGFLGSVTDISDRKRAERLKDEMIALVSHELKAPLTAIKGSLAYLRRHLNESADADQLFEIADRNTEFLVRLVRSLLDIERLEEGRVPLEVESVTLSELLDRARDATSGRAEEFGVGVEVESMPWTIRADRDRIVQVLTNLIDNAIKFSPAGSVVRVTGVYSEHSEVTISVRDQGRGVPAAELERIFERFAQIDGSDQAKGGAGLGLAICRQIVTRHGGRIWAESDGEGSTFSFTLPSEPTGSAEESL